MFAEQCAIITKEEHGAVEGAPFALDDPDDQMELDGGVPTRPALGYVIPAHQSPRHGSVETPGVLPAGACPPVRQSQPLWDSHRQRLRGRRRVGHLGPRPARPSVYTLAMRGVRIKGNRGILDDCGTNLHGSVYARSCSTEISDTIAGVKQGIVGQGGDHPGPLRRDHRHCDAQLIVEGTQRGATLLHESPNVAVATKSPPTAAS